MIIDEDNKNMDSEAYNRFEKTHEFLNENLASIQLPTEADGKFKVNSTMALALLKIAVQLDDNSWANGVPPKQKEE